MEKKNLALWTVAALAAALFASSPGWFAAQESYLYISVFIAVLISISPFLYLASERITFRFVEKKAAHFGAQIRSLETLATLRQIDAVVFVGPKLLLEGHPLITDIVGVNGMDQERLLALAATIEQDATHPLGKAIYYAAAKRGLELFLRSSFTETPYGAQSNLNGTVFRVGDIAWIEDDCGIKIPAEILTRADQLAYHGKIPLAVVGGGITRGLIALKDDVNKIAVEAIRQLNEMGMVTRFFADEPKRFAASIERETEIPIKNGLRPLAIIREIQLMCAKGSFVAVVGNSKLEREVYWSGDMSIMVGSPTEANIKANNAKVNETESKRPQGEAIRGGAENENFVPDVIIRGGDIYKIIPTIKLAWETETILKQNHTVAVTISLFCAMFSSGALVPFGVPLLPLFGVAAFLAGAFSILWFNARRI